MKNATIFFLLSLTTLQASANVDYTDVTKISSFEDVFDQSLATYKSLFDDQHRY